MKYKILFLVICFAIKNIKTKYNDDINNESKELSLKYDVSMKIYNKEKELDNMYLNLTNISKLYLSDIKFSYTGKIIYLNKYNKINILKENALNYRIKWIFMFDSINVFTTFIDNLQKGKIEYFSNVFIVTKDISHASFKYFNYLLNLRIFIFYLENYSFQYIVKKYDYTKNKDINIYARLISINDKIYNFKYLYLITIICLVILIFCNYLFRYNFSSDQRNLNFFFIRTVYFFPIIKISITLFFLVKLKILSTNYDLYNIRSTGIITFLDSSLDIFFKSLFITFSIIISKGIDNTLRISNHIEFLLFIRKFIFVYFILSTSLVNSKYITMFPKFSILCSMVVETFIFGLIYRNKRKTQIDIIKQLNLATLYFSQYISSVKIKYKMFIWHWRVYCFYYIIIFFLSLYDLKFNLIEAEKKIYFHFNDIIIILAYSIIYKPRQWPENFDVIFKSDFIYFNNIYSCKLLLDEIDTNKPEEKDNTIINNEDDVNDDGYNSDDSDTVKLNVTETIKLRNKKNNLNDKNLKKFYKKNKSFPIVILNPQFLFTIDNNNKKTKTNFNKEELMSNCIQSSSLGTYDSNN